MFQSAVDVLAEVDPNLIGSEVAALTRYSRRTVAELTRARLIPHVVRGGGRKIIYPRYWVVAWGRDPSIPLEVIELEGEGRIVRPSRRG